MMRMAMAAADSAMPVEAGEQTITATVTVTWALAGRPSRPRNGIATPPGSLEDTWPRLS